MDYVADQLCPGARAVCSLCGGILIAKCGNINIWHWAHEVGVDCDSWSEPETEWHLRWKSCFPEENREVVMPPHRADVRTGPGRVFEFQHSPLSDVEIFAREDFYGNKLVWVLNAEEFIDNFSINARKDHFTFRWRHPRKSWWIAEQPIFLHLDGNWLFKICKIYREVPCRGWGRMVSLGEFLEWAVNGERPSGDGRQICVCRGKKGRCGICRGKGVLSRHPSGLWF